MSSIPNDQSIDQSILLKFNILSKLGSGAYGHVWKVQNKITRQLYALKKVYSAFHNDLDAERTYREISILKKLDHPNIVKLLKVYPAKNNMDLYLVFQLIQSDLFKAIKGNILNQIHKKYIIYQITKALMFVHSAGVIHRDIKPSNILINSQCKIKLCDFGLSRTTFSYSNIQPVITQFIATRWYRAPEVMLGSQSYNSKSDIWSLGCLIYQMYAYKALLPGKDNVDQIQKLLQFKGFPNDQQKKLLKVNGIDKILGHFTTQKKQLNDYFGKIQDLKLKKLLLKIFEYDPEKRPSAQQILKHSFLEQLRDYQPWLISQNKIKLQQNQNFKLPAGQYRQLIYERFAQKQQQMPVQLVKIKQEIPSQKQQQSDINNQIKQKENNLIIRQKQQQNSKKIQQSEKQKQQKHGKNIQTRNRIKKRTIKQNSLHIHRQSQIDKQNQSNIHNDHNKQNQVYQNYPQEKNKNKYRKSFKQQKKGMQSLINSPQKRSQFSKVKYQQVDKISPVIKKLKKKSILNVSTPHKKQEQTKNNQKSKDLMRSRTYLRNNNSLSLHHKPDKSSSLHKSRQKLPQLIVKPRDKVITGLSQQKGMQIKFFKDVMNARNSQGYMSNLKRQKSLLILDNKKINKKGINMLNEKGVK